MTPPQTLFESPSGLIHLANLLKPTSYAPKGRAFTNCGREVNFETWGRIRLYDQELGGKGPKAIRKMIDSAVLCDRCLPVS